MMLQVAVSALAVAVAAFDSNADGMVGAYLLLEPDRGMQQLEVLGKNAETLPINRLWLAFFSPNMVYEKNSKDLSHSGLAGKYDFEKLKKHVDALEKGGVEVFLSMGGWDYNCFPYLYMRYSVGGYGTSTPNYWSIKKYGHGSVDGCTEDNQFCYVCEPETAGETLKNFEIFPEPDWSDTWAQAQLYVQQGIAKNGSVPNATWHGKGSGLYAGSTWHDKNNSGRAVTVPGSPLAVQKKSDPYGDIVQLAHELGASGVDLDYEEFWHADYFRTCQEAYNTCDMKNGPWAMWQTVYKYAAIAKDIALNIEAINPSLKLSCPAGAASAWQGKWWGGNLKGLVYNTKVLFPELVHFMGSGKNAGGFNIMSYDLSDDPSFHECPPSGGCKLDEQVAFYMDTYVKAGVPAAVGYELGQPAYPSPIVDKEHQMPLTKDEFNKIIDNTQPKFKGGFFWELYKPINNTLSEVGTTEVAQAICKAVLGAGAARCAGIIPDVPTGPTPAPVPTPEPAPTPSPPVPTPAAEEKYVCDSVSHKCVKATQGTMRRAVCIAECHLPVTPTPAPPVPTPTPVTPTPAPGPSGHCHAISTTVTDAWCDRNCHDVPSYCPPQDCKCD